MCCFPPVRLSRHTMRNSIQKKYQADTPQVKDRHDGIIRLDFMSGDVFCCCCCWFLLEEQEESWESRYYITSIASVEWAVAAPALILGYSWLIFQKPSCWGRGRSIVATIPHIFFCVFCATPGTVQQK